MAEGCGGRPATCLPKGDVLIVTGVLRPVDQVAPGRVVVWSTPDGAGALPPPVLGPARAVEHVSLVGPVLPVRQDQARSGEVRLGLGLGGLAWPSGEVATPKPSPGECSVTR